LMPVMFLCAHAYAWASAVFKVSPYPETIYLSRAMY
jgi:hypothetical protein